MTKKEREEYRKYQEDFLDRMEAESYHPQTPEEKKRAEKIRYESNVRIFKSIVEEIKQWRKEGKKIPYGYKIALEDYKREYGWDSGMVITEDETY